MNNITDYILEKLHLNKDTKIGVKYEEGQPMVSAMILNNNDRLLNPSIGFNDVYIFKYFKDGKIFFTPYKRSNTDMVSGFMNSKGIFESEGTWSIAIFLPKKQAEEYYDDLMKYKDNLKDFPYEKYFDTKIDRKDQMEINSMEKIERYFTTLKNDFK